MMRTMVSIASIGVANGCSGAASSVGASHICNNGEGGMGPCFADVQPLIEGADRQFVHTSFGSAGRIAGEEAALEFCGFPRSADPSLIAFSDDLHFTNDGMKFETLVYDVAAYSFKCPEPGKVIQ